MYKLSVEGASLDSLLSRIHRPNMKSASLDLLREEF